MEEQKDQTSPAGGLSVLTVVLGNPDVYWSLTDPDYSYECPDDIDIVGNMPVGTEFELTAAWYQTKKFKVVKVPDETSDDYEVEEVPNVQVQGQADGEAGSLSAGTKGYVSPRGEDQ